MSRPPATHVTLESKVMTVMDVAAYLKCHQSTIYRLLKRKAIPAWRLGSDWRFNVDSIEAWVAKQTQTIDG